MGFLLFILIILIIVYLIIPFVLLARMGELRVHLENLERALRAFDGRLDRAATAAGPREMPAAPPAEPEPTPSAPPRAAPAATPPDIVRDRYVTEPPQPAAPEPPPPRPRSPSRRPPRPSRRRPSPKPRCRRSASTTRAAPTAVPAGLGGDAAPPPSRPSGPDFSDLEKRFGTQWVVWVGGIALALGGILLVRYSIEQGLFGPGLRVIAGAVLALVLVGLGELARRREIIAGLAEMPRAHIPSILTAAGTTVAYADVWAAYALYDFLSPALAFLLLGVVALATLAAALVHGPALGGLGLVGAYVTPLLVSTAQPNYWALYVYLAVVTAAAYALARFRMWGWLAITAAAFSILWMFVGIGDARPGSLPAHAFYVAAGFALAAVFIVAGLFYGPPAERGRIEPVSSGVLTGYLVGAFMLVYATEHAGLALTTLIVLAAATVAIAWRTEAALAAVPVAAALTVLVVVHWALDFRFDVLFAPDGPLSLAPPILVIPGRTEHLIFAAASAALFGVAGYWMQGRSDEPQFSIVWAICAVATPVVILIALYYRIAAFERSIAFAGLALALAAAFAVATDLLMAGASHAAGRRRRQRAVRDRRGGRARAHAHLRAGEGLAHGGAGADGAGHRLDRRPAAAADAAHALRRHRHRAAGAGRPQSAHRARRHRLDADRQLAAYGAMACRRCRSGSPATSCASAPTILPRARSTPPPSCSPRSPPCSRSAT